MNLLLSIFIIYFSLFFLSAKTKTINTKLFVCFEQTTTFVSCCNLWKIILASGSSWLHSNEILNVSFSLLTSIGGRPDCTKSSAGKEVTNKLRRCCLFLMLWKNANYSLLDSIFCSKFCKCTTGPQERGGLGPPTFWILNFFIINGKKKETEEFTVLKI